MELATLIMNQYFVRDLMASEAPCFGAGYVKENDLLSGFLAMRPDEVIPPECMQRGFSFGHSVKDFNGEQLLHFAFRFYGFKTFHTLIPMQNPIVLSVIDKMIETQDYFFFAIDPAQTVTAFRSQMEVNDLASLKTNRIKFEGTECRPEIYEKAVEIYRSEMGEDEEYMEWVCRSNWDYLDIEKYPLDLTPRK